MGWNGDGTFSREHNWQSDADNDIDIVPDRHDDEDDNFAAGIQACLAKNGENTPSADLPMGNNKHTGVGDADARTQYAKVSQVQDSAYSYAPDTGAADAYVMALSPAITSYAAGAEYRFLAGNTNTGASTLNINGVGATAIRKNGTTALAAGDIAAGEIITVVYDGTFFQLSGSLRPNYTGTITFSGQFNADNLRLDGNTLSSTDTDGNINLAPNGTGSVQENGTALEAKYVQVSNKASEPQALAGTNNDNWMTALRTHQSFNRYGLGMVADTPSGNDANNATDIGTNFAYYISSMSPANEPPFDFAAILNLSRLSNRNFQLGGDTIGSTSRAAIRTEGSSGWTDWAELWTTENFDPTDMGANAKVDDYGGTARRVGWVPDDSGGAASSRDFSSGDIGNIVFVSSSITLTMPSGLGSGLALIQLVTSNASTLTLAEGSGVTLEWRQGGSSSSGGATVAPASAITLMRVSSTLWYFWGNGIS